MPEEEEAGEGEQGKNRRLRKPFAGRVAAVGKPHPAAGLPATYRIPIDRTFETLSADSDAPRRAPNSPAPNPSALPRLYSPPGPLRRPKIDVSHRGRIEGEETGPGGGPAARVANPRAIPCSSSPTKIWAWAGVKPAPTVAPSQTTRSRVSVFPGLSASMVMDIYIVSGIVSAPPETSA